jgi:hypothetical protein
MKKIIFCLAAWCVAGGGAYAQVGILTDEPQGMFHIDPQGDTDGSLNTGDDVIVTTEGNVGIGLLPEATTPYSLTLTGGGTPAVPHSPLRIEDGNEAEGRVLTSDADGYATWKDLPAGFTPGEVCGFLDIPAKSFPHGQTASGFTFTADAAGSYLFEIRWWGRFKGLVSTPFMIFDLLKGGSTMVDTFELYPGANTVDNNNVVSLCLTLYGEALVGETFTLRVSTNTQGGTSGHGQDTQASPAWTQSKVKVLRVN